jgi:hypothetical protein
MPRRCKIRSWSVVVAMCAVHVAMRELFRRRRTHIEDRAIEAQPLPGQLMIAVDDDLALGDVGDRVDDAVLIVAIPLPFELHSHLDLRRKAVLRLDANQVRFVVAKAVFRLEADRDRVADRLERQRRLDLRENAVVSAV